MSFICLILFSDCTDYLKDSIHSIQKLCPLGIIVSNILTQNQLDIINEVKGSLPLIQLKPYKKAFDFNEFIKHTLTEVLYYNNQLKIIHSFSNMNQDIFKYIIQPYNLFIKEVSFLPSWWVLNENPNITIQNCTDIRIYRSYSSFKYSMNFFDSIQKINIFARYVTSRQPVSKYKEKKVIQFSINPLFEKNSKTSRMKKANELRQLRYSRSP